MAAWLEATQLAGFSQQEAVKIFIKPAGTPANIRIRPQSPMTPRQVSCDAFPFLVVIKNKLNNCRTFIGLEEPMRHVVAVLICRL